ncbi:hypothetical protein BH11GEM1_BH11GEM1_36110 [soil metagenome]
MLRRRGTALLELLLALALAGVVLSIATASLLRQQRVHARLRGQSGADRQLRAATMVLAGQLAELDATAGDIASGSASDTALQFRATVATSFACEQSAGSVTLLPELGGGGSYAGTLSAVRPGDTLWWLGDSTWTAARIRSVDAASVTCTGPLAFAGPTMRLVLSPSADSIPAGAPLRITRHTRYSLYRSGDGSWQLGSREWNDVTGMFSSPQPVAGPLLLVAGARRSGYRYFDAMGQELDLTAGLADVTRIARIRITMRSVASGQDRGSDSVRTDSVEVGLRRGGS